VDLGFQPSGLLTLRLPLAGDRNAKPERRIAFLQQVEDRVAAMPGVRAVAAVDTLPLGGFGSAATFALRAGRLRPISPSPWCAALPRDISDYGLPLLEGRDFTAADTRDPHS
jgi:hypothetical protein